MKRVYTVLVLFLLSGLPYCFGHSAHGEISGDFSGGGVRLGPSTTTCDGSAEGGLRYNSGDGTVELCNGEDWVAIAGGDGGGGEGDSNDVYTFTGSDQTYNVPAGCSTLSVKLWGAGGGGGNPASSHDNSGGGGGHTYADIAVTAGENLKFVVGQGGPTGTTSNYSGTYGGGGQVYGAITLSYGAGGAGGGYTGIFRGSTPLVIAGGGGGGGGQTWGACSACKFRGGAGGGMSGQQAERNDGGSPVGGYGGTQANGGATGTNFGDAGGILATAGTYLNGGRGGVHEDAYGNRYDVGPSGGGGYYGGGGVVNNNSPGAGGGSGYIGGSGVTNAATIAGNYRTPAALFDEGYVAGTALGGNPVSAGGNGAIVVTACE